MIVNDIYEGSINLNWHLYTRILMIGSFKLAATLIFALDNLLLLMWLHKCFFIPAAALL